MATKPALFKVKGGPIANRATVSADWAKREVVGMCNACLPSLKGENQGRWIVSCGVGDLSFRLCDNHADALGKQLLALTTPHRRANPDYKEKK